MDELDGLAIMLLACAFVLALTIHDKRTRRFVLAALVVALIGTSVGVYYR